MWCIFEKVNSKSEYTLADFKIDLFEEYECGTCLSSACLFIHQNRTVRVREIKHDKAMGPICAKIITRITCQLLIVLTFYSKHFFHGNHHRTFSFLSSTAHTSFKYTCNITLHFLCVTLMTVFWFRHVSRGEMTAVLFSYFCSLLFLILF